MGIINYIEFGGVKSSDYGIYVSGEGTFNAPERDVELIEIPGRNGDFSLDKGRFKNITVTYPVFNYEANLTDFRTRLSDFRNALKSKIGYQRLEDTFHPDEFRMATFIDVFEVQPVMYNTASTIELTFNCKPQRFLKSGEVIQTVTSGGAFTNPTPFSSRPLIEAEGHGIISINGQNVNILPAKPLGYIALWAGTRPPENIGESIYLDFSKFNTGDKFYLSAIYSVNYYALEYLRTTQGTGTSSNADFIVNNATISFEDDILRFDALTPEDIEFTIGTEKTVTTTFTINTTNPTLTISIPFSIHYIPSQNVITLGADTEEATSGVSGSVEGYSSVVIEAKTYIDCEIGEAYYLENGEVISANNSVSLPAILPELKAGNNPITYDDTITELKITPRWWKI